MREMKNSGLEWIRDIPLSWKIQRNKGLFYEVNERCEDGSEYTLLSISEYTGVTPRSNIIKDGEFETHAESLDGYKICAAGDIVMNIMLAWKRATAVSRFAGIVSPAYCVYRGKDIDTRYYHYLFRTDVCADMFKRYSTGIIDSRLRLYPDVFLSLYSIVPPIEEQHRIANFLDIACSQIDEAIEQTRASITEYKKCRQAIIDSKIALLKSAGCKYYKLNQIGFLKNGLNYKENRSNNHVKFLGVGCFQDYMILDNISMFSEIPVDAIPQDLLLRSGDIVFVRSNGTKDLVGRSIMVDKINYPLTYSGFCIRFRNCNHNLVNNKYLLYYFRSEEFKELLKLGSGGTNINNLSQDVLNSVRIPIPEMDLQVQTVEALDNIQTQINGIVSTKKRLIMELEAYKKSLIYEYVTGKKEVM